MKFYYRILQFMNHKKIIHFLVFILFFYSYNTHADRSARSQRTTDLIEFVKEQESHLSDLQKQANTLMDKCVGECYSRRSHYYTQGLYIKRSSASLQDFKKLHEIQQKIFNRIEYLKEKIENLIDDGQSFSD